MGLVADTIPVLDPYIQYGSFGLVAMAAMVACYTFFWFITKGMPNIIVLAQQALNGIVNQIEKNEDECRKERALASAEFRTALSEMSVTFSRQMDALRTALQSEAEANRKSRHEQGNLYQKSLMELMQSGMGQPRRGAPDGG